MNIKNILNWINKYKFIFSFLSFLIMIILTCFTISDERLKMIFDFIKNIWIILISLFKDPYTYLILSSICLIISVIYNFIFCKRNKKFRDDNLKLKSENKRLRMHNTELENDLEGLDELLQETKLENKDLRSENNSFKNRFGNMLHTRIIK